MRTESKEAENPLLYYELHDENSRKKNRWALNLLMVLLTTAIVGILIYSMQEKPVPFAVQELEVGNGVEANVGNPPEIKTHKQRIAEWRKNSKQFDERNRSIEKTRLQNEQEEAGQERKELETKKLLSIGPIRKGGPVPMQELEVGDGVEANVGIHPRKRYNRSNGYPKERAIYEEKLRKEKEKLERTLLQNARIGHNYLLDIETTVKRSFMRGDWKRPNRGPAVGP